MNELTQYLEVFVENSEAQIYLKKRGDEMGLWESSISDEVGAGESYEQAAVRLLRKDLGIKKPNLEFVCEYKYPGLEEYIIKLFICKYDGEIKLNKEGFVEGRFFATEEINTKVGTNCFTPSFELAYKNDYHRRLKAMLERRKK